MEISIPPNIIALGTRIADALDTLTRFADANYKLAKEQHEAQAAIAKESQCIVREDLEFRREQAAKAEQQQAILLQMFTHATPAEQMVDGARRKRRDS